MHIYRAGQQIISQPPVNANNPVSASTACGEAFSTFVSSSAQYRTPQYGMINDSQEYTDAAYSDFAAANPQCASWTQTVSRGGVQFGAGVAPLPTTTPNAAPLPSTVPVTPTLTTAADPNAWLGYAVVALLGLGAGVLIGRATVSA